MICKAISILNVCHKRNADKLHELAGFFANNVIKRN